MTSHTVQVPPLLLRPAEVADLLGISLRKVSRLADDGQLERLQLGGNTRYRRSDVEALVEGLATPPSGGE